MAFAWRVRAGDIIHINVEIELPGQIRRVEDPAGDHGNDYGIGVILAELCGDIAHACCNTRFVENDIANSVSVHSKTRFRLLKAVIELN